MYQWRSLQVAARSGVCPKDIQRARDGVAASLRQFHISAQQAASDTQPPRPSRSQAANTQIQGLPQRDAPRELTITRRPSGSSRSQSPSPRGANAPGGFQRGSYSPRGTGRGGAVTGRGGRPARGRGGIRGGQNASGPPRRRRVQNRGNAAGQGDESSGVDEYGYKLGSPDEVTPDTVIQAHAQSFVHPAEPQYYETLMELVEDVHSRGAAADQMLSAATKSNDAKKKESAEAELKAVETDLKWGLAHLLELRNQVSPRHAPGEVDLAAARHGAVGNVPVGKAGMGAVVEDALRFLTQREGHAWIHKSKLRERLTGGELVKFTSGLERKQVLQSYKLKDVGFEPLDQAAKQAVVSRLVKGHYQDTTGAGVKSNILQSIARVTNGSYDPSKKATLLNTVKALLPKSAQ